MTHDLGQLGKQTVYSNKYDPNLLFPIPRNDNRSQLGIDPNRLKFHGVDIWNHYEISWLDSRGKPIVAIGEIIVPANSPNIVESKSMKLYFNGFNATKFSESKELVDLVIKDLSGAVGTTVSFSLSEVDSAWAIEKFNGVCLDGIETDCTMFTPCPDYLKTIGEENVCEQLYSNLLKSNCLVTMQPDWGSVYIEYTGRKIEHAGLLKYIISFREHNEFHEHCVERMFCDIMQRCTPKKLTVYARYTRRGGLDINPFRTLEANVTLPKNIRLLRQ